MTEEEILNHYPELESDDFRAVYELRRPRRQAHCPVKLLLDENLSRKLVPRLSEWYPGSAHLS